MYSSFLLNECFIFFSDVVGLSRAEGCTEKQIQYNWWGCVSWLDKSLEAPIRDKGYNGGYQFSSLTQAFCFMLCAVLDVSFNSLTLQNRSFELHLIRRYRSINNMQHCSCKGNESNAAENL